MMFAPPPWEPVVKSLFWMKFGMTLVFWMPSGLSTATSLPQPTSVLYEPCSVMSISGQSELPGPQLQQSHPMLRRSHSLMMCL